MATFAIHASSPHVDTQIDLEAGDIVRLRARGRKGVAGVLGPAGTGYAGATRHPLPGLQQSGLYAQYSLTHVVPLPHARDERDVRHEFTALFPGRLKLKLNDDMPTLPGGYVEVDVQATSGPAPAVTPYPLFIPANKGRAGVDSEQVYRGLEPGDVIVLEAFGMMNNGALFADSNGPGGYNNESCPAGFPAPHLQPYCLYVETGTGSQVARQRAFQGTKFAPYAAVRFVAGQDERWLRVRLNDHPVADNQGEFRVFVWRNAEGQHLAQYGVHVAQPAPIPGWPQALTDHARTGRAFPRGLHSISPYAVRQTSVGNCFVLAALASMAHTHPQYFWQMITDHHDGTYTVQVYDGLHGRRVSLLLDSVFPPYLSTVAERDGSLEVLWPLLLQKAYCFMQAFSYLNMATGGISYEPWDMFCDIPSDWHVVSPWVIREWLPKTTGAGRPLAASTFDLLHTPDAPQRVWNIVKQHVYGVLDYEETGGPNGDWEVYLFNPHRNKDYEPGMAKDEVSNEGDGFFWMPLSKMNDVFGQLVSVPLGGDVPRASMYLVDTAGRLNPIWSTTWRYPWNRIVPVRWGNKIGFLSHRDQDCEACLDELNPNTGQLTEVWRTNWDHRWTLLAPVFLGRKVEEIAGPGPIGTPAGLPTVTLPGPAATATLFQYVDTGVLRFDLDRNCVSLLRFQEDGSLVEVWCKEQQPDWDVVVPISHGFTGGILKHRFADRTFEIELFDDKAELQPEFSWQSGTAEVIVPVQVNGQPSVLFHCFKERLAMLQQVVRTLDPYASPPREVMHLQPQWSEGWTYDWDVIVPVAWGASGHGILSYDSDTGHACLDQFGSDGRLTEKWRKAMDPRPNLMVAHQVPNNTWVLTHTW